MASLSLAQRLKQSLAASAGDIVFGMEDGTVSIFGLVLGVAATTNDSKTVLIAGASGACAAAVSMMAGTYLEIETDRDEERRAGASLAAEIAREPHEVARRLAGRLRAAGLSDQQAEPVLALAQSDKDLLRGLACATTAPAAAASAQSPLAHALWMLVADFVSAAVPIIPFALAPVPQARIVSTVITVLLLICLGVGRARVGGQPVGRTVLETVSIGVAAALAGVGIGLLIARLSGA